MQRLTAHLRSMVRTVRSGGERAASLVEYALLVALIALVMVSAVTFFGDTTGGSLNDSSIRIRDAVSGPSGDPD